jgi:hypothetical protein
METLKSQINHIPVRPSSVPADELSERLVASIEYERVKKDNASLRARIAELEGTAIHSQGHRADASVRDLEKVNFQHQGNTTEEQIAELLAISIEVEELRKEKERLRKENEQFGKHLTNFLDDYEAVYQFGNNHEDTDDQYIEAAEFMKRLIGREHIVEHIEQCRFEAERERRECLSEREYEPDDL